MSSVNKKGSEDPASLSSIMEKFSNIKTSPLETEKKRMNLLASLTKGCTKEEARKITKLFEESKNLTYEEIHHDAISPFYFYPLGSNVERGSSKHSKKLYKLTRQLTRFKNHLGEKSTQTYLLGSVEEVISLVTCYRKDTRELPFHWAKQRFLAERHRGAKLLFPSGLSRTELEYTLPEIIHEESDDERDTVEGSLDQNMSRLGLRALAVSYLSCLDSICKAIDDLSKEKIKRLSDIYKGLGGCCTRERLTAGGELRKLEIVYGSTKKGLLSRLEEDRSWHLQSMTNSGPKQASSSSKGKAKLWRY